MTEYSIKHPTVLPFLSNLPTLLTLLA
jgi:hypothetical protein